MALDESNGEPGEGPVHYQVSITGRQAAGFFLGLLAVLSLAFFFGMKTGAAARRGPNALTSLAQVSDLPMPTPAPLETPKGAPAADVPDATRPAEPGEKRLGFEDAAPAEAESRPDSKPESKPEPKKAEGAKPDGPKADAPKSGPKKSGVAAPSTSSAPAASAPAAKTAATQPEKPAAAVAKRAASPSWFVQAMATKNAQAADDLAKRLKKAGWRADVSLAPGKPGVFRVRVGPYAEKAKAEAASRKIRESEKARKLAPAVVPG